MRISILAPDISSNAMARTCPIAKVLSRNHEVEIIGFDSGDGFFEPYEDEFEYTGLDMPNTPWELWKKIKEARESITGDVCYAFRPLVGSLGVALLHKRQTGTPVVLDVEDVVRFKQYSIIRQLYNSVVFSGRPTAGVYSLLLEQQLDRVDEITVTSSFLSEQYGGTVLPYGPDEKQFDPETVEPDADLSNMFDNTPIISFIGTVRPHKGLDILAETLGNIDTDVKLVIAGFDPNDQVPKLNSTSGGRIHFLGPVEHEKVPSYLAATDLVVIPQKRTDYTEAQVPNKVFEAMAMAKPIIASRVSDLPCILDGAGRIVEPGNPDALGNVIKELLEDDQTSQKLGDAARERYIKQYGHDALEKKLRRIFDQFS